MESLEFFGGFVKLDLGCLCLSHFLFEFCCLASDFDGKLFDLESELLNFRLISTSVLFESQVVLFLLPGSERPLLQLLLVPVHLQFELVHLLIRFEDLILDVVETVLLVSNPLFQFFDLIFQTTALTFGNLFQMFFGFNFLVFGVYQTLGVHKFHFYRFEMLVENLQSLLMLLNLQAELSHQSHLLTHDLIQFLILLIGIRWEVLIQVVLGNRVYNIVSHPVLKQLFLI